MAQKRVILRIGYSDRFLMDVDDAARVASLLATSEAVDFMRSYGKGEQRQLSLLHRESREIQFEAVPEGKLYPDGGAAKAEIDRIRAEEAQAAERKERAAEEEERRQSRALGEGAPAIPLGEGEAVKALDIATRGSTALDRTAGI